MDRKRKIWINVTAFSIIAITLSYFQHTFFWVATLVYGLLIYALINLHVSRTIKRIIETSIWGLFALSLVLGYTANHNYPTGPIYSTGEYVCENDDRGPCHEQQVEDTSNLDVPAWVKYFKSSAGELTWFALLFAGIVSSSRKTEDKDS